MTMAHDSDADRRESDHLKTNSAQRALAHDQPAAQVHEQDAWYAKV